jgi:hypothetical protein
MGLGKTISMACLLLLLPGSFSAHAQQVDVPAIMAKSAQITDVD